jgi:NAD(P)-dependent dehydrogenase (short-subunit alcohol dehydrogenase family)
MAVELAPRGIRVNALAPTYVETPLTRPFFKDPAFRAEDPD